MFGLSFGELCVLLLVAVVVLGPKELPRYLRKAGQLAGRMRRLAYDMRAKSGIDEVLRAEGIAGEIAEIRKLARGELGGVVQAVRGATDALRPTAAALGAGGASGAARTLLGVAAPNPANAPAPYSPVPTGEAAPLTVDRAREYPSEGADSYGALPDTAAVYHGEVLPASPLASDALYARGDAA